ncbi:hypothetical protein [Gaoshiqia sp. Z1-71]|uniref:hypothetical protein n=1 Tax=Gaoshiqia hydrogeniformans TaxID=3290090 RepID=UPI003BF7F824
MKTMNNKQGRKNNQVSNFVLKGAAVIVSVVLLSFTVSAQGLWKQLLTYNSFGKMAMLMVHETEADLSNASLVLDAGLPAEAENFGFEQTTEESLEVENWMTNEAYFGGHSMFYDVATDDVLNLEGWMTDESYFSNRFTVEKDDELKLEDWMCDNSFWAL